MTSEEQNDVLFQEALESETARDWKSLRSKCEQGLQMEGIAPSREALFRRLRAKSLFSIATARRESYDAGLLQEAIEDAKRVVTIYANPEHYPSYGARFLAEAHVICGDASYALVMTPSGSSQKGELIAQAIEQYEKSLQIEPQNKKIREMLDHVKQHPAAKKQSEGKGGCASAIVVLCVLLLMLVFILR